MKKELLDAQRRLSSTVEDVDQWSPREPDINAFDTSELEQVYGQSFDMARLGQAVFSTAMEQLQDVVDDFRGRMGLLESDAYEYERQLASDDGQTRAAASYALERNLTAQAQRGANTSEGSEIARMQDSLTKIGSGDAAVAGQAAAMAGQEDMGKRVDHFNSILSNNQSMINALMGQGGASQGMGQLGRQMAGQGLQRAGEATSNIVNTRLAQTEQTSKYSGLERRALQGRLDIGGGMTRAGQSAYTRDQISRIEADQIRRGQTTKKIGGLIGAAGGVASWLTGGKGKGKKK